MARKCVLVPVLVLVLAAAGAAMADDSVPGSPGVVQPIPTARQVTVALSLPSDVFAVDMMPGLGERDYGSFRALFTLVNAGPRPLRFLPCGAKCEDEPVAIQFVVYDSNGCEVWSASREIPVPVSVGKAAAIVELRRGMLWRIPCRIPLAPGGTVLPAGSYTLEARVNGSPCYGAYAAFEVVYAY